MKSQQKYSKRSFISFNDFNIYFLIYSLLKNIGIFGCKEIYYTTDWLALLLEIVSPKTP